MDLLVKISAVLGLIGLLIAIVTGGNRFVAWLLGRGKQEQAERGEIKALAAQVAKTPEVLEEHVKNQAVHVNAELENYIRGEDKAFKADVKAKLDELLRGKN